MKATTVVFGAALLAAFAAILWSRSSLQRRIGEFETRLTTLTGEVEPIRERHGALEERCQGLELRADADSRLVADLDRAAADLRGDIASHDGLLAENAGRIREVRESLSLSLDEESQRASETRALLEDHLLGAVDPDATVTELGLRLARLEERLEVVPAGAILPWLPDEWGVPPGWLRCDGSAGTPDLRGLFLRGAGSTAEAGLFHEAAQMQPAGAHSHGTREGWNIDGVLQGQPRSAGDWRVLFDAKSGDSDPVALASHGSHTHEDEHVPTHYTVAFIMKERR